jgi:hypothetical protein
MLHEHRAAPHHDRRNRIFDLGHTHHLVTPSAEDMSAEDIGSREHPPDGIRAADAVSKLGESDAKRPLLSLGESDAKRPPW